MYNKSVYERALLEKERETNINKARNVQQLQEAASKSAELNNIDVQLKNISARVAVAALSQNSGEFSALQKQIEGLTEKKAALQKELGVSPYTPLCPVCKDTGRVAGKLCECVRAKAARIALEDLAAISPLSESRFDNFNLDYYNDTKDNPVRTKMQNILAFCKDYAENFTLKSGSILFLGGTGLGKTHLSLAIAGEVIKKGYGVLYGTAQNLFNQMGKEHFSYGDEGDALMDEAISCDLLIIDDLGTEFSTQFTLSCVYNIVNTRLLYGLPTIISTNMGMAELEQIYSPRVLSRIIGNYSMKKFDGNDIRQIKAINKKMNKN